MKAALDAKKQGKVRYIGFSGHKHPDIHLEMLKRRFYWDAVMLPLNVFDAHFRSFEKRLLPVLNRRGIGSIGIKSLSGFMSPMLYETGLKAEDCIRYVMSLPISTLVSGMESMELLQKNLRIVKNFRPMTDDEKHAILIKSKPLAGDGRYEKYKTTMQFEAPPGQRAHGYMKSE